MNLKKLYELKHLSNKEKKLKKILKVVVSEIKKNR